MKAPIIILHGWGSLVSGEKRFGQVKKLLEEKGYEVYTPDLPGFGSNALIKNALSFADYVQFVKDFLAKKKIKKVILIGHSFGGRIAIAFTAQNPSLVLKLILVSASGIPQKLSLKQAVGKYAAKVGKSVFKTAGLQFLYQPMRKLLYRGIGEMDYYKAGNLAQTFKNVYHVSIVSDLEKITVPTLLVWGEDDKSTPLSDGKYMHEKIKKSRLVIIKRAGHTYPYEQPKQFVADIVPFIQ